MEHAAAPVHADSAACKPRVRPTALRAADAARPGPGPARLRRACSQAARSAQAAHPAPTAGRCAGRCHGCRSRRTGRAAAWGWSGGERSRHCASPGQPTSQPGEHNRCERQCCSIGQLGPPAAWNTRQTFITSPANLKEMLPTSRTTGSAAEYCLGGEPSYESLGSPLRAAAGAQCWRSSSWTAGASAAAQIQPAMHGRTAAPIRGRAGTI